MKRYFNWHKFMSELSLMQKDLVELLEIKQSYLSVLVRADHISINVKRKLDINYGQEFINQFIGGHDGKSS